MQHKKSYVISLFTIFCIIINVVGKFLAASWQLPVWADSFGTVLAAYVCGPGCGAIVGAAGNIISNFSRPAYMVYALTSILIGIIVGVCARKKYLESMFGILTTGFLLAMASVVVSTPLNVMFFHGYTGNRWGDGVINLLKERGIYSVPASLVGEYYVDFIDKVLTLVVLYAALWLYRRMKKKQAKSKTALLLVCILLGGTFVPAGTASAAMAGNISIGTASVAATGNIGIGTADAAMAGNIGIGTASVAAAGKAETDYNAWLQTVYDDESGLPGGIATDIAQTEDGVLWIGTYGGLYRYNGNEFQWMNEYETIKNVNCFFTDDEGRLWIGTNDNGVSIFINNEIANVVDETNGLPSNSVRYIAAGKDGNYYVGTTGSMAVVSISSGLSVVGTIPEIVYTTSISVNRNGYAAVVADNGTLYLLDGTQVLEKKTFGAEGRSYTCAVFAPNGELYAGTTGDRVIRYAFADGRLKELERISCAEISDINSLRFGGDGTLFVCAINGAGWIDGTGEFHKLNLNQFNSCIDHMLLDYQGNLWFTSSRLGLLKLCETPFTEIFSKLQLPKNVVNSITKWQDTFYFATDNGLFMADYHLTNSMESALTERLAGVRIRCLLTDSRNTLWISTSSEGTWHVKKNGSITVYDGSNGALGNKFRSVVELSDGTIVLAGDYGLTFVKDGEVVHTIGYEDGLENPKVLSVLELADGTLLAGTDGNGIAVICDGKVVRTLQKEDGLSSKVILRLVADPKGTGVFVVTGNSLCFMDLEYHARTLSNFPYFNNYDVIVGENGKLFVLSSAGIYLVDRDALLAGGTLEYTLLDSKRGMRIPLTANSWDYVDEKNNLYLAGDSGVILLNMDDYHINRRSYRMNLRAIQIDDEVISFVKPGDVVGISRDATRIVISPEIINYSTSNPYVSYYLEGFETTPQICLLSELKEAVYTNLSCGSYAFHLAVLDEKGGVASENIYRLWKEEDIYDESWFLLYVSLVFVLTIVYLTWMLFRTQIQKTLNIQKRELELAKKQVEMGNEAILTIAKTVDAKDIYTSQHSYRVAEYSGMIAKRLGFSADACEELRRTALLHDIGKIGVPDGVLNKPSRLTEEEYEIMKSHVTKGAEILRDFTSVAHIVEGALYHHERYDGKGYVEGLKGEEIPLNARIIGIADAFDAMTSNRVYRKKLALDRVVEELKKGKGTQFDPKLVDILLSLIEDGTIRIANKSGEAQENAKGGAV